MASEETIDFSESYISEFRLQRLDPLSWEPVAELTDVHDIQVDRDCTDQTPLLETGSLTVGVDPRDEFVEGWYRLYIDVQQGRDIPVEIPISTLWLEATSGTINHGITDIDVSGYSVLKPLEDRKIIKGEYVPKDYPVEAYLRRLLFEATPAPVQTEGSFSLKDYFVFEPGQSYLEAAWMLLDAAGWCIVIDGDGTINIAERPKFSIQSLNRDMTSYLMPGITYNADRSSIPNRYIVVNGRDTYEAVNNNPDSRVSYISRGWYKDVVDTSPTLINGESLETYAKRKLEAASTITKTWSYTREWIPGLKPFHLLDGNLPEYQINEPVRILSQQIKFSHGLQVTEKIGLDVKEYKA